MQRLLNQAHWGTNDVRDNLPACVAEQQGKSQGDLVVGEANFVKKCDRCVAPVKNLTYSGTEDRIANCQVGVVLA